MDGEEATPVIEVKQLVDKDLGVAMLRAAQREREGDMSQSYHEIFDTQGYQGEREDTVSEVTSPEDSTPQEGSVASGSTETGVQLDSVGSGGQVYYNEGEGRLECEEGGDPNITTKYLTSKLVADSLMWQQTFRNDSPSPEEIWPRQSSEQKSKNDPDSGSRPRRPNSLETDMARLEVESRLSPGLVDPQVLNDLEKEARRLATEVDSLVENLSCILQSVSALTVDTVETYRDGVCKTCDEVDNNIRAMYQLMAKWEELNKNMAPAYRASSQIKDIKRLLDMFEAALG